jgi:adenylate cyclase
MTLRSNAGAEGKRHGSSSADSQRSVDTIKGPFASFLPARGALAMKAQPRRQYVYIFHT